LNKGQILASLEHRLEHQRNATIETGTDEMKFNLKPLPVFLPPFVDRCPLYEAHNDDALASLGKAKHDAMIDLAYIDSPYGGGQSDYASMFRFLGSTFTVSHWKSSTILKIPKNSLHLKISMGILGKSLMEQSLSPIGQ